MNGTSILLITSAMTSATKQRQGRDTAVPNCILNILQSGQIYQKTSRKANRRVTEITDHQFHLLSPTQIWTSGNTYYN